MATTLKGKAVVWGNQVGATLTTGGTAIISSDTAIPTDATFERIADTEELLDASGNAVGKAYYAAGRRFTITAIPADRDAAPVVGTNGVGGAQANMDNMLPAPGTSVTISDAHSTAVTDPATFSSAYQVTRSTLRTTNTGPAVIEMDLVYYDAHDITIVVS